MNFSEYITEASKYELQVYGIINSLYKNCMPFIQELRKSGSNVLWRGTHKVKTKSITQVTPRQDRYPKDMPEFIHDELDSKFQKEFGWRPRGTGVFVISNKRDAGTYGDEYIFFPVGKYRYLYNPDISDLFSEVDGESMSGYNDYDDYIDSFVTGWEDEWEYDYGEEHQGEWEYDGMSTGESDRHFAEIAAAEAEGIDEDDLDETLFKWIPDMDLADFITDKKIDSESKYDQFYYDVIKNYRDSNLNLAITRKVEIMFQCKTFYLVNEKFLDAVQKYVIGGEKLDFDPKQSKLEFEKSPMTRRNIQKQKGHPDKDKMPWEFEDGQVSKMGNMSHHKKYAHLAMASKGQQKGLQMKGKKR